MTDVVAMRRYDELPAPRIDIDTADLPTPTTDRAAALDDLNRAGYCYLADALSAAEVDALRTRLDEQADAERALGIGWFDSGPQQVLVDEDRKLRAKAFSPENGGINQRVFMLVNKGGAFVDLLEHAVVSDIVEACLGPGHLLSAYTANIANPGGVPQGLHVDQWWLPRPVRRDEVPRPPGSIARYGLQGPYSDSDDRPIPSRVVVNVMYMLSDFTDANGGTRLVPYSHLSGSGPDNGVETPTIAMEGPAGTACVFDGRIWHGTGANRATDPRVGILATYCGPQFRPQENFTIGTRDEVLADASPALLTRLGFGIWNSYGHTTDPSVPFASREAGTVGELRRVRA